MLELVLAILLPRPVSAPTPRWGRTFVGFPALELEVGGVPSSWVLLEVCLGRLEQKTSLK